MVDWLSMGGYGAFVWGAYGFAFVVLTFNLGMSRNRRKKIFNRLKNIRKI